MFGDVVFGDTEFYTIYEIRILRCVDSGDYD